MDIALAFGLFITGLLFGLGVIAVIEGGKIIIDVILFTFFIVAIISHIPLLSNFIDSHFWPLLTFGSGYLLGDFLLLRSGG